MLGVLTLLGATGKEASMTFTLTSTAFNHGQAIPSTYTCDGRDLSPPLAWTEPPSGTKSLALISDDPDAPMGTWVHWVVWNIPADSTSLPETLAKQANVAGGIRQGMTDFGRTGYGGPCPPSGVHRYFFTLYALDTSLDLPPRTTKAELLRAMDGHVLAEAQLMGRYSRSR
jgi:Raf kinase inhibitor-like YbhB/YbcL family protein